MCILSCFNDIYASGMDVHAIHLLYICDRVTCFTAHISSIIVTDACCSILLLLVTLFPICFVFDPYCTFFLSYVFIQSYVCLVILVFA